MTVGGEQHKKVRRFQEGFACLMIERLLLPNERGWSHSRRLDLGRREIWIEMTPRHLFFVRSNSEGVLLVEYETCCQAKSEFSPQASHSLHQMSCHGDISYVLLAKPLRMRTSVIARS